MADQQSDTDVLAAQYMNDRFGAGPAAKFEDKVREFLCHYIRLGLERDRRPAQDDSRNDLQWKIMSVITQVQDAVARLIRRHSNWAFDRHYELRTHPPVWMARRTAYERHLDIAEDRLLPGLLDRHLPDWRERGNTDGLFHDWATVLDARAYAGFCADLGAKQIDPVEVRKLAWSLAFHDRKWYAKHLCCVAVRLDEPAIQSWKDHYDPGLLPADRQELEDRRHVLTTLEKRIEAEGAQGMADFIGEVEAARREATAVYGRHGFMFVTHPVEWSKFVAQVQEHFDPGKLSQAEPPSDWEDICDGADVLIVWQGKGRVGDAALNAETILRLLMVLSRVFRDAPSHSSPGTLPKAENSFVPPADRPCRCRLISWLCEIPPLLNPEHFPWWPKIFAELADWKEQAEFYLSGAPFVSAADLEDLKRSGLLYAFRWLLDSETDQDARRIWLALECFDRARAMGRSAVATSAQLDEAWAVIAYWQCLETLYGGKQEVFDRLPRCLRKELLSDPKEQDHRMSLVRLAEKVRNEFVHAGRAELDVYDFDQLQSTVAIALQAAIRTHMREWRAPGRAQ